MENRRCVTTIASPENYAVRFLYFDVDDSFMFDAAETAAEVSILLRADKGCDAIRIDYDSGDPTSGPRDGAFRPTRTIPVNTTNPWQMISVQLPDVRFCNRAHEADFRIAAIGGKQELTVAEVAVRRLPGKVMSTTSRPAGK